MSDKSLLSGLRGELAVKQADAERVAASFKVDDRGRFSMSTEQHRDYVGAVKRAEEIKSAIDAVESKSRMDEYLAAPEGSTESGQHYAGTPARNAAGVEVKDLGSMFTEAESYSRGIENGYKGERIRVEMEGKSIFSLSAGQFGGQVTIPALGSVQNLGMVEARRRTWHIRDLFPKSSTRASVLYGVREVGWVNNARQVKQRYAADGVSPATGVDSDVYGRAPRSKINLTPVLYPVAEVAHLIDAHKNILNDEPRLKTFLNTRMIEGVKYAEDYDLLHSVGDGEKMTGLFNTPGVQNYTGLASDKHSVQVRRAITKSLLAEYDPTGLVVSPTMWESIEVEEDKQGAFRVALQIAVGAEKRVWQLNVVQTTAMSDDEFLLGAFGMGAALHDREAVSVTVSTENSDNFERGVVTFRADERVALEVPRPESFVIGTWTDPTP